MRSVSRFSSTFVLALCILAAPIRPSFAGARLPQSVGAGFTQQTAAADQAVAWLKTQQQDDGGFPAVFAPEGLTLDVIFAAVAMGEDVSTWRTAQGNPSPLDLLANALADPATDYPANAADTGKLVAGVVAAGRDPTAFGEANLAEILLGFLDGTGSIGTSLSDQAWGMLGFVAMRTPISQEITATLLVMQNQDGGWGWDVEQTSDSNSTAVAIQALVAARVSSENIAIQNALDYLRTTQDASGGFGWQQGAPVDPNSTAYAIQALVAARQSPFSDPWLAGTSSPLDALLALQLEDGGFPGWQGTADVMATAQAVPALLGRPFPFAGAVPAIRDALSYVRTLQQADGGFPNGLSSRALLALSAAGEDARLWKGSSGASLIECLPSEVRRLENAGQAGRLAAALAMANENPYWLGYTDLIDIIHQAYDPSSGSFDPHANIWNHALALWGLSASSADVPAEALTWLLDQRNDDGGWGWASGQVSDSNSTALAMQALIGCGLDPQHVAIAEAMAYLQAVQISDGGFPWNSDFPISDTDSTAMVIQAILATGDDPSADWDWARTLTSTGQITATIHKPMDRLLALQTSSGAFEWRPGYGENPLSTLQAIPALARRAFAWQSPTIASARRAAAWLKTQQQDDGSFPAAFAPEGLTLDVIFGAVAMGEDVSTWRTAQGNLSPLDFLANALADPATDYPANAAETGKLVAGVVAAGMDPTAFGEANLEEMLLGFLDGTGSIGTSFSDQAWGMLGFAAVRTPMSQEITATLLAMQNQDGGWGWDVGQTSDSSSTAVAIQALVAARVSSENIAIQNALDYLKITQDASGGFGWQQGVPADPNSTAYVIQALVAARESPFSDPWLAGTYSPLDALLALQLENGGFPDPQGAADVMATAQAVPGLLLEGTPLRSGHFSAQWMPLVPNGALR